MPVRTTLTIFLLAALFSVPAPAPAQDAYDPLALWEHASIYRDEWGTPHVYGDTFVALAFAFGYAQAEDHLEPMLVAYRVANGRAAEIFGESYAQSDEFSIKMGHAALARKAMANADPLTRDLCEGFAIGVNSWIVEHPDRTPAWAEGVKPEDVLALMHCFLMSMAPFDLPNTWHRPPAAVSGNAWAVGPSRSETGEPILVINPHTAYDGPFQWYEAHLVCQDLDMAGATLFGLPVILEGHNDVLGWALAPNQPDFADMYTEPPVGEGGEKENPKIINKKAKAAIDNKRLLQMLILSSSQPYHVNTPQGMVERAVPYVDTSRGPIIGSFRGQLCAYKIGGYRDFGALAQLVEMGRAKELAAFRAALAMQQLPCFHVIYADKAGNISYIYNVKASDKAGFIGAPGKKARRASDAPPEDPDNPDAAPPEQDNQDAPAVIEWNLPVPADKALFNWGNVIPEGALPSVTNPSAGYLQACGTPPWAVTDNSGIKRESLPRWFALDRDTYRAQRVRRLLGMGKRSFRDCQSMLYDVVVPFAMEEVPKLVQLASARPDFVKNAHPDLPAGIDTLKTWNLVAENNSPGMTFFHAWWSALQAQNLAPFRREADLYAALERNDPAIQDAVLRAAADAARLMRNDFASVTVPWGEVHTLRRGAKEVGLAGAATGEPIFTASDSVYEGRKWRVTYGYGFAMVVAFGEKPTAVSMVPFGSSENASSPHYADQLDLMAQRRLKVTRFETDDVERYASSARGRVLYLRPKGMEGVITVRAPIPIEARLNAAVESAAKLPDGFVPFTLFVEIEKAPSNTPVEVEMAIPIPKVLCATENLKDLAVYGCGNQQKWIRLDDQRLDEAARTFSARLASANDPNGFAKFAVLGPEKFRAQRLVVPGQPNDAGAGPLAATPKAGAPGLPVVPQPEKPALPAPKPIVITNVPSDAASQANPKDASATGAMRKPIVITNVPSDGETGAAQQSGDSAASGKKPVIITNVPSDAPLEPGQKRLFQQKGGASSQSRKATTNEPRDDDLDAPDEMDTENAPDRSRPRATMDGQPLPEIEFLPRNDNNARGKSQEGLNDKGKDAKLSKKQKKENERKAKRDKKLTQGPIVHALQTKVKGKGPFKRNFGPNKDKDKKKQDE